MGARLLACSVARSAAYYSVARSLARSLAQRLLIIRFLTIRSLIITVALLSASAFATEGTAQAASAVKTPATEIELSKPLVLGKPATNLRLVPEYAPESHILIPYYLIAGGRDGHNTEVPALQELFQNHELVRSILSRSQKPIFVWLPQDQKDTFFGSPAFQNFRRMVGDQSDKLIYLLHSADAYPSEDPRGMQYSAWARDWAGLAFKISIRQGQSLFGLLDPIYANPNDKSNPRTLDQAGGLDEVPLSEAKLLSSPTLRRDLPIFLKPGQITFNSRGLVFLPEKLIAENKDKYSGEKFTNILRDQLGIRVAYFMPSVPGSIVFPKDLPDLTYNGHTDMWMKFLSDDVLVVSQLDDETIKDGEKLLRSFFKPDSEGKFPVNLPDEETISKYLQEAQSVQKFLAERIKELKAESRNPKSPLSGLKVLAIPLPFPYVNSGFPSYANAIIYDNWAFVPDGTFSTSDVPGPEYYSAPNFVNRSNYFDENLKRKHQAEVTAVFNEAKLSVVFFQSSTTQYFGSFHCLSSHIALGSEDRARLAGGKSPVVDTNISASDGSSFKVRILP